MTEKEKVSSYLDENGIKFQVYEHPPIPTIDDAMKYAQKALETSLEFLNAGLLQSDDEANERISRLDKMSEAVSDLKSDIATLNAEVKNLKEDTEGNPLSG